MKRCEFADSEKLLPQNENIMEYIASNTNLLQIAYKILFDILWVLMVVQFHSQTSIAIMKEIVNL